MEKLRNKPTETVGVPGNATAADLLREELQRAVLNSAVGARNPEQWAAYRIAKATARGEVLPACIRALARSPRSGNGPGSPTSKAVAEGFIDIPDTLPNDEWEAKYSDMFANNRRATAGPAE